MKQQHKLIVLLVTLSLALSACGEKKSETAADASPAVKVNGHVISDAEFQLKGGMHMGGADKKHSISEDTMQSVLKLELLRQAALESKLDTDENVRARMATSMRSILATAYLDKVFASVTKPTPAAIEAYYKQHPERFSERKQLAMKELVIPAGTVKEADIREVLGKARKAADFEKWLQANKIAFNGGPITNTTDQIPEEALLKLKDVPVGGSMIQGSHEGIHVIFVLDAQPQPVPLEQASPMIANLLLENGRKEAMDNMLKTLLEKAKIEYVAPYTEKGLMVMEKQ